MHIQIKFNESKQKWELMDGDKFISEADTFELSQIELKKYVKELRK